MRHIRFSLLIPVIIAFGLVAFAPSGNSAYAQPPAPTTPAMTPTPGVAQPLPEPAAFKSTVATEILQGHPYLAQEFVFAVTDIVSPTKVTFLSASGGDFLIKSSGGYTKAISYTQVWDGNNLTDGLQIDPNGQLLQVMLSSAKAGYSYQLETIGPLKTTGANPTNPNGTAVNAKAALPITNGTNAQNNTSVFVDENPAPAADPPSSHRKDELPFNFNPSPQTMAIIFGLAILAAALGGTALARRRR